MYKHINVLDLKPGQIVREGETHGIVAKVGQPAGQYVIIRVVWETNQKLFATWRKKVTTQVEVKEVA